jgi:hypothetical protein
MSEIEELAEQELHGAYHKILSIGYYVVEFTKADGSMRVMKCTRDPDLIPVDVNELTVTVAEGAVARKPSYSALRVYEFGVGWRSFKIANVVKLTNVELANIINRAMS